MSIIKTDGRIQQNGATSTTSVTLLLAMTTTSYNINLTKLSGESAYPLEYSNVKTIGFEISNYQSRYNGKWQVEGY